MSIHRGVWNWIGRCEGIARRFFGFGAAGSGGVVLLPEDRGDGQDYIDGTKRRVYGVELARLLPLTLEAEDEGNIAMLEAMDAIGQWIAERAAAGDYPDLGAGRTVTGIDVFDPQAVTALAMDGAWARYALCFAVHYLQAPGARVGE